MGCEPQTRTAQESESLFIVSIHCFHIRRWNKAENYHIQRSASCGPPVVISLRRIWGLHHPPKKKELPIVRTSEQTTTCANIFEVGHP